MWLHSHKYSHKHTHPEKLSLKTRQLKKIYQQSAGHPYLMQGCEQHYDQNRHTSNISSGNMQNTCSTNQTSCAKTTIPSIRTEQNSPHILKTYEQHK